MPDDVMSAREALEKAFGTETAEPEVVTDEPAGAIEEPKEPEGDSQRARDERGRFAAKAEDAKADPEVPEALGPDPALDDLAKHFRQHPEASAMLATADPALRSALAARLGEMEKGIGEHRDRWEPLRRFDEMARAGGTTLAQALENYTNIEQTLARNPVEGIDLILRNMGSDVRSFAAHVLGQKHEPNAEIGQLRQKLEAAERELQGYRTERRSTIEKQVSDFFTANPRANEVWRDMQVWIQNGFSLEEALKRAEVFNPAPIPPAARTGQGETPEPRKQPVSVRGAPSSGSHPVRSTEILSAREAIQRAMAATR